MSAYNLHPGFHASPYTSHIPLPSADRSQRPVGQPDKPIITGLQQSITSRNPAAHVLGASASAAGPISGPSMGGYYVAAFDTKEKSHRYEHGLPQSGVPSPTHVIALPHISTKFVEEPSNFNGKAKIIVKNKFGHEDEELIVCRHLAAFYVLLKRQDLPAKVYVHELFKDPDTIKHHIPADIEKLRQELLLNANGKHIFPNENFDHFLVFQAREMIPGQKKQFLVETSNHSMACELHYTLPTPENDYKSSYVVRFFDPNKTNVVTRCVVSNPDDFIAKDGAPKTHALWNFIGSGYQGYFQGNPAYPPERECIVYDCSNPASPDPIFKTLAAASEHGVSAAMMYHVMCDGRDPGAVYKIAQKLKSLSFEKFLEVLAAKCSDGTSGLHMALQKGHYQVIEAYQRLLREQLPMIQAQLEESEKWLKDLLEARGSNKMTGLYVAALERHARAMESYGRLLDILTLEKSDLWLEGILAEKGINEMTGWEIAIKRQQELITDEYAATIIDEYAATIGAYEVLMEKLLPGEVSKEFYFLRS